MIPHEVMNRRLLSGELIRGEKVIPNDFDVVIMNPPFTRRERIPAKTEELAKLVPEVKGKTGYWAYFVVAADKVLKEDGTLALVIPEEFFAGGAAKSVREYLFHRGYRVKYVVKSTAELAFSESALYRDYLIVLKRAKDSSTPLTLILLNKKLDEIKSKTGEITEDIRSFVVSSGSSRRTADFTALKVLNAEELLTKH